MAHRIRHLIRAYLANAVTISRIVISAVMLVFTFHPVVTFWLLIAGIVTDIVDGPLSRLLGATSPLGKRLDTFADSSLFTMAIFHLAFIEWLPIWFIPVSISAAILCAMALKVSSGRRRKYLGLLMTASFFGLYGLAVAVIGYLAYGRIWYPVAVAIAGLVASCYYRRLVWYYRSHITTGD